MSQKNYSGSKTSSSNGIKWKSIINWHNYQISSNGQVRNIITKKILKPYICGGYYSVYLSNNGSKKQFTIHRLIAVTFIPNPNKLPMVDHVNNNRLDNRIENLRWVTGKENSQSYVKNFKQKKFVKILQYDKKGNLIKEWDTLYEILNENPKYHKSTIYTSIVRNKTAYGYIWKSLPNEQNNKIKEKLNKEPNTIYINKFKNIGKINKRDFSNYQISLNGVVINNKNQTVKNYIEYHGYERITLVCRKSKKNYTMAVHRLVAYVYIKNDDPVNKIQVNHIDKNRKNNNYKNLEWVTPRENTVHASGRKVKMIDPKTDEMIKIFNCVRDAEKQLGLTKSSNIGNVCNKKSNNKEGYVCSKCAGYKWEWA